MEPSQLKHTTHFKTINTKDSDSCTYTPLYINNSPRNQREIIKNKSILFSNFSIGLSVPYRFDKNGLPKTEEFGIKLNKLIETLTQLNPALSIKLRHQVTRTSNRINVNDSKLDENLGLGMRRGGDLFDWLS